MKAKLCALSTCLVAGLAFQPRPSTGKKLLLSNWYTAGPSRRAASGSAWWACSAPSRNTDFS